MYCPICFNDTLKIASSGVIKFTFNGKSKATSQLYYNLTQDSEDDLLSKLDDTIDDYFKYYSGFQNCDPIKSVSVVSIDFKCRTGCVLSVNHKVNMVGMIFTKDDLKNSLEKHARKYNIPLELTLRDL